MQLYEGAKDDSLLQATRHTIRWRGFNTALVVVACLAIRFGMGLPGAVGVAAVFATWFFANLAFAATVPWLRRRGILAPALTWSMALGTVVIGFGCWVAGGAVWLGTTSLILNLLYASLSLPKKSARKVYLVSSVVFLSYLALAAFGQLPSQPIIASHLGSLEIGHRLAVCALLMLIFGILCYSADFFTTVQDKRVKSLHHANDRLRALNEQMRDKHFSLLCSQQDLILANEKLKLKSEEVLRSQDVIRTLAAAVEAKDNYTEGHSSRVSEIAVWLARELGLNGEEQTLIKNGCILHDIGKINISDLILRKAGPLSAKEFEQMKRHPVIGEQICKPLAFAKPFLDIIRHHHERMDGRGYPDGLAGEEISLPARIAAIADAWDAMTSDRPYRKALPHEVAFSRLREGAGLQWDEHFVEVFIGMMQRRLLHQEEGVLNA